MNGTDYGEEAIFERALHGPTEAEREAFLRKACGEDRAMYERLMGLVEAHERAGRFLEGNEAPGGARLASAVKGAAEAAGLAAEPAVATGEKEGDHIGRYRLVEPIAEGGFGAVWLAEQEEPVRRRVALKIIKLGMDTRQMVARFKGERQALELMDHPNIARVFDGGCTEAGRPYFVMELVEGVPITIYAERNKISLDERLALFIEVCQAVQHAHQKGIIHRDLKPSNILVSRREGRPVPKVIDFGVAKALEVRRTDKTLTTGVHQVIGTPAYMSPEQAGLSPEGSWDIDTRSDIYALGVLLYVLLTGCTPFDSRELTKAGMDAMRRFIRETDPPKPSTRLVALLAAALREFKSNHGRERTVWHRELQEKRALIHRVRGNLDWIVMRCLERDRSRRYPTANALAADVQRHLNHEPVVARPPN